MTGEKIAGALGLCRRAGKMKIGCDTVIESINLGNSKLVIMASDISENTKKKVSINNAILLAFSL